MAVPSTSLTSKGKTFLIFCLSFLTELLQTLVHEQVHQWQAQFGKPSLRTYHNREWADKVLSVGLTPSSTGRPGGMQTGQQMADYPTEGGVFLEIASGILAKSSLITWYKEGVAIKRAQEYAARPDSGDDQASAPSMVAALAATLPPAGEGGAGRPAPPPSKVGYQCPECRARAWGKPDLSLICGTCFDTGGAIVRLEVNAVYLQEKDRWVAASYPPSNET